MIRHSRDSLGQARGRDDSKNMDNNQNLNQDKIKAKELEAKVENYVGPEGITTKQLEIGLWYVEHKRQLRMIFYGFLIVIAVVSWTYTIYGFAYYLARGLEEDEILTKQLVQSNGVSHDYVTQISAKQLALGPVGAFKSNNKYDLYVQIKNDNRNWWAEFNYYFEAQGARTEKASGYILPLEDKYFLALSREFANPPSDARLIMENISWHRVNAHQIPDWSAFSAGHLAIASADVKFTPANLSLLSERLNLNQLSFTAVNQTAYNYWEVGFAILLESGGSLVGVNHYTLNDFMSGQKRPISLSWPGEIGRVDRVEIIPEINIMKNDIYIPQESGVGQEQ